MAQAKVGFLKLILGATPEYDTLQKEIREGGKAQTEASKKFQSIRYAQLSTMMVGIAAVGFEFMKAAQAATVFEQAFAGIRKTVEASERQFAELGQSIIRMSTVIPVSTTELARIGELGGQLGIAVQNLPSFIQTVSTLATTTNLTVDNAALGLARLDAIAQTNGETFENVASTIVDLGNNFAATESEIMTTVLRIAQAAAQVGATTQDALAFATALQAIGVPAQAGGTAVARVFQSIQSAIIQSGDEAKLFADIAAQSGKVASENFAQLFGEDPAQAAQLFIEGLAGINAQGGDVITMLEKLGLSQRRTTLAILGLAEAGDLLERSIRTGRNAFEENTAATDEAIKRYSTFQSQLEVTKNTFNELQIQIGENTLPVLKSVNDTLQEIILGFTVTNKATGVLIGSLIPMTFVAIRATGAFTVLAGGIKAVNAALLTLAKNPLTWFITVGGLIAGWALKTAQARGEIEQLNRTIETFSDNGEVTNNTIKAVIKTTKEFQDILAQYSGDEQYRIENLLEPIAEDPQGTLRNIREQITAIESYIESVRAVQTLGSTGDVINLMDQLQSGNIGIDEFKEGVIQEIENTGSEVSQAFIDRFAQQTSRGLTYETIMEGANRTLVSNQMELQKMLDVEKIGKAIADSMIEVNKARRQKLRDDAREALGIDELAESGSGFRAIQETWIANYIAGNEAEQERIKLMEEEKAALIQLETVYGEIDKAIKETTDSFVASFETLPEVTIMTAEEMATNFAKRFAIAEIFKDQMKQLEDLGMDDLGLLFAGMGPEAAPQLQELLDNPEAMRAIEAGLEAQQITANEKLKENAANVQAKLGEEYAKLGQDVGINLLAGFVQGLDSVEDDLYTEMARIINKSIHVANLTAGNQSPSRKTQEIAKFMMLGFVKGVRDNYPTLETEFKGSMIDVLAVVEQSVGEAIGRINNVFGSQFNLFGSFGSLEQQEQKLNDLYEERNKLLKGNTAEQTLAIREAQDKVDFLRIAYAEGVISAEELQIAEDELAKAQKANAEELKRINQEIENSEISQAQGMFGLAQQAYEILQLGPEGIAQFKEIAKVLGIDEELISKVTGKTEELANTLGTKFAGVVDGVASKFFETNMQIEQEEISVKLETNGFDLYDALISRHGNAKSAIESNSIAIQGQASAQGIPMQYKGGRVLPGYYKGGRHTSGLGIVGEFGPELIRALPGGGAEIMPIGATRGSSITVNSLNVYVTGVPSDPMQARKAAIEIRKALAKLDREGLIGTGIRGR